MERRRSYQFVLQLKWLITLFYHIHAKAKLLEELTRIRDWKHMVVMHRDATRNIWRHVEYALAEWNIYMP